MLTGKDILELGYPEGPVVGYALQLASAFEEVAFAREELESILSNPEAWGKEHKGRAGDVARALIEHYEREADATLHEIPVPYPVWGLDLLEGEVLEQMGTAMRLPISLKGALMPDAHYGYGLPVGGVLGTDDNTVIPYAVGVDIACRMHMSIFDIEPSSLFSDDVQREDLRNILVSSTNFGPGGKFKPKRRRDHSVLYDERWEDTQFLKELRGVAVEQLGTSGGGNHFVEWGSYLTGVWSSNLAIVSHSGSRAVGYKICDKYSKKAAALHKRLPKEAQHLGWLELDSEEGIEYWRAMELAGEFAKANHEVIHDKMCEGLGARPVTTLDHHHNFAWKEDHDGVEMVVHRKGATPAAAGEMGVIPGDTIRPGYVVEGNGSPASLKSASHGAGRRMSRSKAFKTLDAEAWAKTLEESGVTLLGGSLDEASDAYKDISEVMRYQEDLVSVKGTFVPSIVRMAPTTKRRY